MQHPQSMIYISSYTFNHTHQIKNVHADGRNSFGQYICNYIFCIAIHQLNQTFLNFVSHKMMMNLDIFVRT
jgi:hypothetical protein